MLNSLHNDYKIITTLFFQSGNQNQKEIQQIVIFTEAANLIKQVVRVTTNLTILAKKKQSDRRNLRQNEEYFNCKKKSYYTKNCYDFTLNKKRSEESTEEAKHTHQKKNQDKAAAIRLTNNNDSNVETYPSGQNFMPCIVGDKQSGV